MFIFLEFSVNNSRAGEFTGGHNDWIMHDFDYGMFLWAGSLQPGPGGFII